MNTQCCICLWATLSGKLCKSCGSKYLYDSKLRGFRLKKTRNGTHTRHIASLFHKSEIKLTKILESHFGAKNVVTSYRPLWAESVKGSLLEYDIYVPSKNLLIEYNGRQHYHYTRIFHRSKAAFRAQRRRDRRKERLAKKNGFKFIVFRYDEPMFEDYIFDKIGEKT